MVVKDNHPILRRKIERFFAGTCLFDAHVRTARTREVGRGRIEERELALSNDVPEGYTGFPGVQQLFRLTRRVIVKRTGEIREETVYGMTSLSAEQADPKRLLALNRGHWHIENKSHYVRDVTFREDHSQVRTGSIPQVMAALRNACIGLMRIAGHTNIAAACRYHAAQPLVALALLGIQKTE